MNDITPAAHLDGTWQMLRAEYEGEQAPEMVIQRTTLEFADGLYRVCFQGEPLDQGRFETSLSGVTKMLILYGTFGTNKGRTIRCIYQHMGDRLRVCYGLDGIQPMNFTTAAGQKRYLATYRRDLSGSGPKTVEQNSTQ
jgi:uncharacterized protein (TIGR03067 family)